MKNQPLPVPIDRHSTLTRQTEAAIRHLSATYNRANVPAKVADQIVYRQSLGWTGQIRVNMYAGKVGKIQLVETVDEQN